MEISGHDWYLIQHNYFLKIKEIYCINDIDICEKTFSFGKAFFLFYKLNNKVPTFDEFVDYLKYKGML